MKKREIKSVYELTKEELEELELEEGKEELLFEGDPDIIRGKEDFEVEFFFLWSKKKQVLTSGNWDESNIYLLEFVNGSEKRQLIEKNNWEGWDECKNIKIAFRNGVGYIYHLFEYIE